MTPARRHSRRKQLGSLAVLIACSIVSSLALETSTHELINRQAVVEWKDESGRNIFDQRLAQTLGLRQGSATDLAALGRPPVTVREWIEMGGTLEDLGDATDRAETGRFWRHFHDPLRAWNESGLTFHLPLISTAPPGPHESSARWLQRANQSATGAFGGNWSWADARRMYHQALTEPDPRQRDALLAATFRALGQVMHLVVDASVPEHVRNDEHPLPYVAAQLGLKGFWNYEKWIQMRHGADIDEPRADAWAQTVLSNPIGFDPSLLQEIGPDPDGVATVPISRLIDSNLYGGPGRTADPSVTFNAANPLAPVKIGLAEIANANFYSEDKFGTPVWDPYPPFPKFNEPGLIPVIAPTGTTTPGGQSVVRRWYTRPAGRGLLPVNPLKADCISQQIDALIEAPCVDGVVWNAVAAHMLPRAVGYARGVLEYFFRGRLKVKGYQILSSGVFLQIENLTDEPLEGTFEIYARHGQGTPTEMRQLLGALNGGATIALGPLATGTYQMPLSSGNPSAFQMLVFRGCIGLEQDGVIGQIFSLPFVQVTQESYRADILNTNCTDFRGWDNLLGFQRTVSCLTMPINHRASARLITNFGGSDPTDPTQPAIEGIRAFWRSGSTDVPAPLMINGVLQPSGVWARTGSEPDPGQLEVRDPAAREGSRLMVEATVRAGDNTLNRTFSLRLGTLRRAQNTAHVLGPLVCISNCGGAPQNEVWQWTLNANREVSVAADADGQIQTLGGFPNPMAATEVSELTFVSVSAFNTSVPQVAARQSSGYRSGVYYSTGPAIEAAVDAFDATLRFPEPPGVHWSAVATSKPILASQIQFRNAFGPDPGHATYTYTLVGQEAP